jgi:hypothetical protein
MYEKILQKLKEQRGTTSTVSDRSLEDLARSLEPIITTDEILGLANLTNAIKSIEGNISHYTKQQLEKIKADEKKAAEDAAKKAAEKAKAEGDKKDTILTAEQLAGLIKDAIAPLATELAGLKQEKTTNSRVEKLQAILKGLPDFYTKPLLAGFVRTSFTDDTEFDTYLGEVTSNRDAFNQAAKEQGLNTFVPVADVKKPVETGETPEMASAREILQKHNSKRQEKV